MKPRNKVQLYKRLLRQAEAELRKAAREFNPHNSSFRTADELGPTGWELAQQVKALVGQGRLEGFTVDATGGIDLFYYLPDTIGGYTLRSDQMQALLDLDVGAVTYDPRDKFLRVWVRRPRGTDWSVD